MDPRSYMRLLAEEGIRFIIVKVMVMGLPRRLLGVPVEGRVLEEVLERAERYGFHPAFEGGEAETLVFDAPHYKRRLCIEAVRRSLAMYEHVLEIRRAWLAPKDGGACIRVDGETYE